MTDVVQILDEFMIKNTLDSLLSVYPFDTENANLNFELAVLYHKLGHTASAITYYLRAAERTDDKLLSYECLLKIAACFDMQKNRASHVVGAYKHAICLLPKRPEAYFLLSRFNEQNQWYMESYVVAEQGLEFSTDDGPKLKTDIGYPGRFGLIFEKAVSAWWWGKPNESRKLFRHLKNNYASQIDDHYKNLIAFNLSRIGSGPKHQAYREYTQDSHSKLRFKFPESETISKNFSQLYQDIFVLSMLNGKKNGTYVEIGSAYSFAGNNTALLETQFDWKGIGVEIDSKFLQEYQANRKNPIVCADARFLNYEEICRKLSPSGVIDYLQVDCEPPEISFEILKKMPFDKVKFAVITFEHDHYVDMTDNVRNASREFLESKGYKLIVGDVSCDDDCSQEDWWVHPDLVDQSIIERMTSVPNRPQAIEKYFLENLTLQPIVEVTPAKPFFAVSQNQKPTVWVVDNFYQNPDAVREFAMAQTYVEGGAGRGFIGRRTEQQFLFTGLKEKFEQIMNRPIVKWQEHGMNGRFQCAWAGEPLVYHCDDQRWGGMLYLTPNAPFSCGTTLYAHKQTRARTYYEPGWDASWINIPGDPHLDATPFEPVDVVGNVYNRLVIFDASCIHSASQYFGTVMQNSRLWQMFFFD